MPEGRVEAAAADLTGIEGLTMTHGDVVDRYHLFQLLGRVAGIEHGDEQEKAVGVVDHRESDQSAVGSRLAQRTHCVMQDGRRMRNYT